MLTRQNKNNINNERLPDGSTTLHNEVRAGNVKTIKLLITQGTDFNVTDDQGKTPLDYAPTEEIKQILIYNGLKKLDKRIVRIAW